MATSKGATLTVPDLGPTPKIRKISSAEQALDNGLTVLVVRRPGVPMVEIRLRIPFMGRSAAHPAQAQLLADAMLAGTAEHDREAIATAVQELGGSLSVSVDADRLMVGGSALATRLPALLGVLAEVLGGAGYPNAEVAQERLRLVDRLTIARSQAGVIAHEALAQRLWGEHPYALDLPRAEAVEKVTAAQLRRLHENRVRPHGATLVIVGDVAPKRAVDQVTAALAGWTGRPTGTTTLPRLPGIEPGPARYRRPARIGAVGGADRRPGGGAIASGRAGAGAGQPRVRWLLLLTLGGEHPRGQGYTYSPRSAIEHHALGSLFSASADVATEVTAASILETQYELGRIASVPVKDSEVEAVRQYAIGTLALSIATQSGLASTLASLAGAGLGLDWLAGQPARMAAVTTEQVSAAAAQYLAPARLVSVIVGDAAAITGPLSGLTQLG